MVRAIRRGELTGRANSTLCRWRLFIRVHLGNHRLYAGLDHRSEEALRAGIDVRYRGIGIELAADAHPTVVHKPALANGFLGKLHE